MLSLLFGDFLEYSPINGRESKGVVCQLVDFFRAEVFLKVREPSPLGSLAEDNAIQSYLPQEASIFRKLTVEENLMAILETLPIRSRERRENMEQLIEQLGLEKVRRSHGYMLSGGERRRVEIARSLVISPSFLLLDEPFSGIDPIQVLELQRIIFDLKRAGIGILVTDHNVRETLLVTDRAYIINNGRIFRAGSPEALGRDPEVKRVYLGESFNL